MITPEEIQKSISEAEIAFNTAWEQLEAFRSGKEMDPRTAQQILLSFQPNLAAALYLLQCKYGQVAEEQRRIVQKKIGSNEQSFVQEMKRLRTYKEVLSHVVDIGKTIGDSFVWMFYQREHDLLLKHYEQQPIPSVSTGSGGRGEILFLRSAPKFGKYIVIAHSITSFLRLGDVSLVDPETHRVVAIGELKSHSEKGEFRILVNLIGPDLRKEMLPTVQKRPDSEKERGTSVHLNEKARDRLKRQILRIQEGFRNAVGTETPPMGNVNISFLYTKVEELMPSLKRGSKAVVADRGLALVGIKAEGNSLYQRLTNSPDIGEVADFTEVSHKIVNKQLPDNSLRIGWLVFSSTERYSLAPSMRPIFWWPIPVALRKAIVFHELLVMTLYNPAFVISDLRAAGFTVEVNRVGLLRISLGSGEDQLRFFGSNTVLKIIQTQLVPDSILPSIIHQTAELAKRGDIKKPFRCQVNLQFLFS